MMIRKIFMLLSVVLPAALLPAGCTSVETVPLDKNIRITKVKIIENPDNQTVDFVTVCQDQFARWGIPAELYPENVPVSPEDYVLTYTTEREWSIKMFLFKAHIELSHQGKMIASGDYHAIGGMFSLAVTKFNTTNWKMRRVFNMMMRYHNPVAKRKSGVSIASQKILDSDELTSDEKIKMLKVLEE